MNNTQKEVRVKTRLCFKFHYSKRESEEVKISPSSMEYFNKNPRKHCPTNRMDTSTFPWAANRQEYRTHSAINRLWENITSKEKITNSGGEKKGQGLSSQAAADQMSNSRVQKKHGLGMGCEVSRQRRERWPPFTSKFYGSNSYFPTLKNWLQRLVRYVW